MPQALVVNWSMFTRVPFSVIIPLAAHDESWKFLLQDLRALTAEDEVIISAQNMEDPAFAKNLIESKIDASIRWVHSPPGRSQQLNYGASQAKNDFFWFLHADTRMEAKAVMQLRLALIENPTSIYYFNLKFDKGSPVWMKLNTIGVWFRSHGLHLPFGDQGFALNRNVFERLGGFNEDLVCGEDHAFIWTAHHNRVAVKCVGPWLTTSSRKYLQHGWFETTKHHLILTVKQAAPQFMKWLKWS